VLVAKTFDDTRQGYASIGCMDAEDDDYSCPLVMPPAALDVYAVGPGGTVEVAAQVPNKIRATREKLVPLAAGELRGAVHLWVDQKNQPHAALRFKGRPPITLPAFTFNSYVNMTAYLNDVTGVLQLAVPVGENMYLHKYRTDGTEVAPPAEIDPKDQVPFANALVGELSVESQDVRFLRRRLTQSAIGEKFGEPLVLIENPRRKINRFETMHDVLWDRGRFVVIYPEPAKGGWNLMGRTINCTGQLPPIGG